AALAGIAAEPGGPWRVVADSYNLYPSLLTVHGLDEVRAHNPLASRPYLSVLGAAFDFAPTSARYFSSFDHVEHPLLDFLGARAVASHFGQPKKHRLERLGPPGMRFRRQPGAGWVSTPGPYGIYELYRNPQALPRWFLPTAAETVPRARTLTWIRHLSDARRVALVSEQSAGWLPPPRPWQPDAVAALASRPGRVVLAVAGNDDRLLATSLPGPFGWHAEAAGRQLPLLTVNGAFLGVRVPPEVHTVELRYLPPGLVPGATMAGLAALLLAAIAVVAWRGRGQAPPLHQNASAESPRDISS
ncbi:MAG TPA: YfhO family protein, partial [Thermoanaerobaculia bacterium]|nr:YfhO family protein [Thermoanaerobaculia bacterium]